MWQENEKQSECVWFDFHKVKIRDKDWAVSIINTVKLNFVQEHKHIAQQ